MKPFQELLLQKPASSDLTTLEYYQQIILLLIKYFYLLLIGGLISFKIIHQILDYLHMGDQINKLLRAQHQLTQRLGRDPSVEELAGALDVTPQKVENMIQVARRPLSLETPTDDEEDSVLGDFIQDEEVAAPDESATYNLLKEHLESVLNGLPPREVRILQLRYGLLDGQAYTLEEVGRKMGVTRERVRQIEAQALSRLRHPAIRRKLREYLG